MTAAVEDYEIEPCPECKAGKHANCNGETWDERADAIAPCPCAMRGHRGHGEHRVLDAAGAAGYVRADYDPAAQHLADMAYLETSGPDADRVAAAVRGYLFGVRNRQALGEAYAYPSLADLRAHLATVAAQEDR